MRFHLCWVRSPYGERSGGHLERGLQLTPLRRDSPMDFSRAWAHLPRKLGPAACDGIRSRSTASCRSACCARATVSSSTGVGGDQARVPDGRCRGVATPEGVDGVWTIFTKPGIPPFRLMDRVGLDVVLDIGSTTRRCGPGSPTSHASCCMSTSTRGGSASRAAAASTTTTRTERFSPAACGARRSAGS